MNSRADIAAIKKNHRLRKGAIQKRIAEFRRKLSSPPDDIFAELCFCLLTPQSKAKSCWAAIENLKSKKLLSRDCRAPASALAAAISGVRFQNNKSRYLVEARGHYDSVCRSPSGVKGLARAKASAIIKFRNELAGRVKGYGFKEASHFLRNVGLGRNLAILDRHILKNLVKFGVIKEIPDTIAPKAYVKMEEKMRLFSAALKIPMDELDLVFWSEETGEIFK
ncbi:MAG: DNA lyase [Elusimicrobia bacterium HGW-Elusimicrobia-1]|jgi:N-glycosylase/DNA lyase|nr:MAG: DNA lyase [Elusimicrobia bacterium HGW-Elusimicrobia-1]